MRYASSKDVPRRSFLPDVDMRSRKSMAEYLGRHFRYPTANSWNNSTSYAVNMKIHAAGLPASVAGSLYDLAQTEGFYGNLRKLIRKFDTAHDYEWQAGWNGRSGGYLVLYQGQLKQSEHKSVCMACGQRNFRSVAETGTKCGRCGAEARVDFQTPPFDVVVYPGKSTDHGMQAADFLEWETPRLRDRTKLIKEFDALADKIASEAVRMAIKYTTEEFMDYVPKPGIRMVPRKEA